MTHEHAIAFMLGAIAHALFAIWFQLMDRRREIRDARELRRRWESLATSPEKFQESVPTVPPPIIGSHSGRT